MRSHIILKCFSDGDGAKVGSIERSIFYEGAK